MQNEKIPSSAVMNVSENSPKTAEIAAAGEKFSEPHRTVRAVSVQQIMVSKNTSNILHNPCVSGDELPAALWRMGELPRPASFEKRPRRIPVEIAAPIPPPTADLKLKISVIPR